MQRPAISFDSRRRSGALAWLVAALASAGLSTAPCAMADTVDMAAAKAEGTLTWYTSTPQKQAEKIGRMFEQKTGIQVRVFRSGGEATMRRFLVEQSAGTVQADVITTSDPAAFNDLARAGKLTKFTPPAASAVLASAKSADGNRHRRVDEKHAVSGGDELDRRPLLDRAVELPGVRFERDAALARLESPRDLGMALHKHDAVGRDAAEIFPPQPV